MQPLFIHEDFCKKKHILTQPLKQEISLYNIDRSKNSVRSITHLAKLKLAIGSTKSYETFLVSNVGLEDVILELPWLKKANLHIDWKTRKIRL